MLYSKAMNTSTQVIFSTALGASLLFHTAVYSGFKISSFVGDFPAAPMVSQTQLPPKISFEFVDSPDAAVEEPHVEKTDLIASKSTRARDEQSDSKEAKVHAPAMPVTDEASQLAKKAQPDLFIQDRRGAQIPKTEYMTPLDQEVPAEESSKFEEKFEEKEEKVEQMKEELLLLEDVKAKLQKKLEKKQEDLLEKQRKKVAQERKQEVSQNLTPQGNAKQDRQVVVYDPTRNVDTYQAQAVQKFLSTAVDMGSASYNAKKHVLGPYLDALKSKVAPLWHLKLETQSAGDLLKTKKVVLGIQILSDGTIGSLLILQDFGDDLFNKVCLDTFIEVAPFEPLPAGWKEESGLNYLNIIYRFKAY